MRKKLRMAILGAGGLGKTAAQLIAKKKTAVLTAICDRGGYAFNSSGLDWRTIQSVKADGTVGEISREGHICDDSIGDIIKLKKYYDGIYIALPNLPNEFIPSVVQRFIKEKYSGAMVDALKRTRAVKLMFALHKKIQKAKITYITGCGATPGLLTAAAALASQSFVKIKKVNIWWGVGIPNWEEYRATIREDIAHLPGYTVEKARAMSDAEVEALLDQTNGILELHDMEHADDIILEDAGVAKQSQVSVGGIMDTCHAKKPVSTTMTLTGMTFEGRESSHRFILGDETTMADNVNGPALGYLAAGHWLHQNGVYGVFSSAKIMPRFVG